MQDKKVWKKFLIQELSVTLILMIAVAALVVSVDPFFHYHGPLKGISYILNNERYQNNGIMRNCEYDALVTGTSMSENFNTSLVDELFGVNSVKATYAGGYYKEIGDAERQALSYNPDLSVVIRSIDLFFALTDKDYRNPGAADPVFLNDDDPFNDDSYIYNADVLFDYVNAEISRTVRGVPADTFDSYMRFAEERPLGPAYALQMVLENTGGEIPDAPGLEKYTDQSGLTSEEKEMLLENIRANLTANIAENPDVEFYYFYPPYSIGDWYYNYVVEGKFPAYIETMEIITEELLKYDNVRLFCFFDETDMVTDLDNYSDMQHYSGEISDRILRWMAAGEHELKADSYMEYFDGIEAFYSEYDYNRMFDGLR